MEPNNRFQNQGSDNVMTMGEWIIILILIAIPIVNVIMLFVWGFSDSTPLSKKNYARASLIIMAIGIILSALMSAAIFSFIAQIAAISY